MQRGQRLFGRPRIQRLAMSTGDPKHLLHPHPGLRPWLEGGAPAVTPGRLKPGSQGIRARPSGARPSSLSSPDQRPPRALCRQRPLSGIVGEGPRGSPGARREVRNPHEGSLFPCGCPISGLKTKMRRGVCATALRSHFPWSVAPSRRVRVSHATVPRRVLP